MAAALFLAALGAAGLLRLKLRSLAPGDRRATLLVGGRERSYIVHVPRGFDGKTPLPVVLVLHGATQRPQGVERMSGMNVEADAHSFLVVYPSGTSLLGISPTWNSGACCGYAMAKRVDDVSFIRALLGELPREYPIDRRRIYATGISNGAMMAYRLACEMADQLAAIAPVEGAQDIECHPSSPVSLIAFHGTADRLVPFGGGSTPYQMGSRRSDTPARATVAFWADRDGCGADPRHEDQSGLGVDTYASCRDGAGVVLYTLRGGRHMWPGRPLSGNTVPATHLIWSFFAAHPKP